MEERQQPENRDDVMDHGQYWAALRPNFWKIALFSLAVGAVTLLVMFRMPNYYQATAVITPATDDKKQNPALGALVSFGLSIGGPSSVEELESLFRSNDLTVRVFRKYNLWPVVLADKYDPATGKVNPGWADRLFGGEKGPKPPGDWDAISAAKDHLKVAVNRKAGTVIVSFESLSPDGSADIVKHFLDEGKNRLQEEALERASKNKKFIEDQIGKTVDPLTRDRLYSLYGQEVEREMMARNREQFGFKIVDSPRVPVRKTRPHRAKGAISATIACFFAFLGYALLRHGKRPKGGP